MSKPTNLTLSLPIFKSTDIKGLINYVQVRQMERKLVTEILLSFMKKTTEKPLKYTLRKFIFG